MVTDKNGAPLSVGDIVTVTCSVQQINEGPSHPDLEVATREPMFPGEYGTRILLRGNQVTVVVDPPAADAEFARANEKAAAPKPTKKG